MTIYFDLLIFENFIFNLFIFYTVSKMLKYKINIYKLIFSSILSSLLATFILLNLTSKLYLIIVILISFFVNICFCIPKFTFQYFFQIIFMIIFVSFFMFGVITFLNYNFKIVNYLSIVIIFFIIFVIFDITKKYIKKNMFFNNYIFDITLKYRERIYKFKGFLDTGNELKEPITGLPVIIVEKKSIPGIFYHETYFFKIPYKVITGDTSYFEGIILRNIHFKNDSKDFYTDVILCTTEMLLDPENRFEAILSRCII